MLFYNFDNHRRIRLDDRVTTGILSSWRCVVCGFAISSGADVGIAISKKKSDWAYLVLDGIFSMTQVVREKSDKRLSPYLHKILVKVFSKDLHLFMNSLIDPPVTLARPSC